MKNALKIIAVLIAAFGSLYLAMFRHGAKNYVYGKNDSAWDIYHRFNSDAMNFKATPHRDCGADTQSDFSADCAEILQAY
ncbi:MAG: hypothetical protein IIZ18_05345 [Ruminococcus sp.]|nr:hypothetical protein [Ruminococcus sp.]